MRDNDNKQQLMKEIKQTHDQAVTVPLDQWDMDFAESLKNKRESTYIKDGNHIYQSKTDALTDYDKQSKTGVVGETAVSRYVFGDYAGVDLRVWDEDGDDGVDMRIGGFNIDVKTTTHAVRDPGRTPHLLVEEQAHWENRDETDAYVLAAYDEVDNEVELMGWIPHDEVAPAGEFVREGESIVSDGTPIFCRKTDYVVHPRHLRPMSELV